MYVCNYLFTYAYTCVCIYIDTCTYIYMYVSMYIYVCIYVYICTYVCMGMRRALEATSSRCLHLTHRTTHPPRTLP